MRAEHRSGSWTSCLLRAGALLVLGLLALALLDENLKKTAVERPKQEVKVEERLTQEARFVWADQIQDWALDDREDRDDDEDERAPGEDSNAELQDVAACAWHDNERPQCGDKIINQLLMRETAGTGPLRIAIARDHSRELGRQVFLRDQCRVSECLLTEDLGEADAIIWPNADVPPELSAQARRGPDQIWIAYLLESPANTFDRRFKRRHRGEHEFNWTASYRWDSEIVTPYSKFVPYFTKLPELARFNRDDRKQVGQIYEQASERHKQLVESKQKATRVAWFVSNCHAHNERLEFARELAKFIPVDIYGKCGNLTCDKANQADCLASLNLNYKFYLAFENTNSREYITEKLFRNAYAYNDPDYLLLPIVMGPSRGDYERLTPRPESFIHVNDFESAKDLAEHLHWLGNNHASYYSYFHWKTMGRFIETKFLCRTCAMLHNQRRQGVTRSYPNIQDWWWA